MKIILGSVVALMAGVSATCPAADASISPQWEWARASSTEMVGPKGSAVVAAACPSGKYPVSGGYLQSNNPAAWTVAASYATGSVWRVNIRNTTDSAAKVDIYVWVLCAKDVPQAPTSAVPAVPTSLSAQ